MRETLPIVLHTVARAAGALFSAPVDGPQFGLDNPGEAQRDAGEARVGRVAWQQLDQPGRGQPVVEPMDEAAHKAAAGTTGVEIGVGVADGRDNLICGTAPRTQLVRESEFVAWVLDGSKGYDARAEKKTLHRGCAAALDKAAARNEPGYHVTLMADGDVRVPFEELSPEVVVLRGVGPHDDLPVGERLRYRRDERLEGLEHRPFVVEQPAGELFRHPERPVPPHPFPFVQVQEIQGIVIAIDVVKVCIEEDEVAVLPLQLVHPILKELTHLGPQDIRSRIAEDPDRLPSACRMTIEEVAVILAPRHEQVYKIEGILRHTTGVIDFRRVVDDRLFVPRDDVVADPPYDLQHLHATLRERFGDVDARGKTADPLVDAPFCADYARPAFLSGENSHE